MLLTKKPQPQDGQYNSVELSKVVTDMITRMGRFHKIILLLLCVHNFNVAINHTLTSFHTFTPKFECSDNNDSTCKLDDCPGGYEFEGDYETVVTEFELVCSRRLLAPLINTLYFCGVTAGAIICGTLADVLGRKKVVLTCLYCQGGLGILLYFVGNLELFIVIRTVQGIFVQGLQGCTYALLLEHCAPNKRTAAGVLWEFAWGFGLLYLATCSYFIPNWHYLHIGLAIPTFLTLTYIWIIPESITWLIIRDRCQEAYRLAVIVAKRNGDTKFFDDMQALQLHPADEKSKNIDVTEGQQQSPKATNKITDVLRNPILRKHTMVMTSIWFAVTLSYYGILYFLPNLAGERHLNFAVGALVELIAYFIAYFVFSRYGRRIPMATYQYMNAALCFMIAIVTLSAGDAGEVEGHWSRSFTTVLALLAKGLTVSSFCGMFIYAAECFPTGCRGAAMGLCGLCARVGSLLAPQLLVVGDYTFSTLPIIVVGVAVSVTATITLYLPETLGIVLPNTIDDVNILWGKQAN